MIGQLLGMVLGVCMFVSVSAAELHWCDGCTSEQERAMLARIDHEAEWTEVYVGDLQTRTLRKYGVARSWGQVERYDVRRRRTDPGVMAAFLQLVNFHDIAPRGWRKAYALRIVDPANGAPDDFGRVLPVFDYPTPSVTAQDVLMDPRQRRFLEAYLQADMQRRIPVDIDTTRRSLDHLRPFDATRSPVIQVQVHFMDGSRITSTLDLANASSMRIDERTARDAHDRTVSADGAFLDDGGSTATGGALPHDLAAADS